MKTIYKWLPIVFGCHCKKERSFHFHEKQFPICARCTGELIGIVIGLTSFAFYHPPLYLTLLATIPMLLDGFFQLLTSYESRNWLRCATGIEFGYALAILFMLSVIFVYQSGLHHGLVICTR